MEKNPTDRGKQGTKRHLVVERTLSWLNRFRRLKIRYTCPTAGAGEHRADINLAFLQLGCALISLRFLG